MKSVIISFAIIFSATFAAHAQSNAFVANVNNDVQAVHNDELPSKKMSHVAAFPGGMKSLVNYLQENLAYPMEARENAIEGKVKIVFEVTPSGQIQSASVLSGIGYGCDEEALRVVNTMPNWLPAQQAGYPVTTKVVLPITFNLTAN